MINSTRNERPDLFNDTNVNKIYDMFTKAGELEIKWGKYIISAPAPFERDETTLRRLDKEAGEVMKELVPEAVEIFKGKGWTRLFCGRS